MVSLDKEPKQPDSELLVEEVVESEFTKETRAKRFKSTEVHDVSPVSTAAPVFQDRKRYPCHMPTTLSMQREQRILERLQEDKFILKVELYSRLEDLEKDRESTIDRKTLDRTLQRLQQESHCKLIIVSVPLVSNCSRKRTTTVVLHPSVELSSEILSQIHEKLRNFDMQSRGHGQSKFKRVESVPNLTRVSRKQSTEPSNIHSLRDDSVRANGFISAKMVRVRMLHRFLWTHVRGLPYWNGDPFSENHISNCEMTYLPFESDLAVKAMPLELFLQVIGSVKKIKDLAEIRRNGALLCNIPDEEYKNLMDKDATGRFSWLVDVMRRLKLLRLVMEDRNNAVDSGITAKAVLTYALELKPYIEEPAPSPVVRSLAVNLFDLRPRFRHVFSLFNMEAVDSYWKTLEQCFSVADPATAARAFPGSSVPEIFFQRSWASVRVMSIEQQSELLKRIASDDLEKRLTARDCKKIAKELNMSLEQVLRVSYEKNRKGRLLALQKEANDSTETSKSTEHAHLSKRKRLCYKESTDSESSEARSKMQSVCQDKAENAIAQSKDTQLANEEVSKEVYSKAGNKHQEQENENELDDDDGPANAFVNHISLLRSKRKKRFPWTEKSDRSLITCYARYRAMAGPRVHCVDWSAITNLPAPPTTCRRRIAALKHMPAIRKAIMKLCELLKLRYLKYLQKCNSQASREGNNEDVSRLLLNNLRERPLEEEKMMHFEELGSQWDDFNDSDILAAIENIMKCRSLLKSSNVKRSSYSSFRLQKQIESAISKKFICNSPGNCECGTSSILKTDNVPHDHLSDPRNSPTCVGTSSTMEISASNREKSAGPKSQRYMPKRVQQMLEKNNFSNKRMVRKSLAVANAVELIKLIFLNSTMNTEASNILVTTLRRYDENDACAAFNFLRAREHVVIGHGAQPFVLSQKFFHDASASPFPIGTGERASNLEKWLRENRKELQEDGLILPTDLQCGDLFHLFSLVSSGTFNISPFIPQKGIEEPDTPRGRKRRFDKDVANSESQATKQKLPSPRDGKLCSQRERGFPGTQVHLICCAIPVFELISRVFSDTEETTEPVITDDLSNKDYQYKFPDESDINSEYKYLTSAKLTQEVDSLTRFAEKILHSKESFEEMETLFHANWFEIIFDAVANSSEEGLSLDQILQLVGLESLDTHYIHIVDAIVETLQVFNYVKKVNAFDHVRVISQHKSAPYFLNVHHNDPSGIPAYACDKQSDPDGQNIQTISSSESEMHMGNECPIEGQQFSNLKIKKAAQCHQVEPILSENDKKVDKNYEDVQLSPNIYDILKKKKSTKCLEQNRAKEDLPIYPWFTADGQTYTSMFKALARRVIGIIMQYPGILEENMIQQLDVLNPQTARNLLELLQLDNHIFVRTNCQSSNCNSPPSILKGLIGANCRKEKTVWRRHYYANSRSTSML